MDQKAFITVGQLFPVGAIYMSFNTTNPATLFGGTWTQIDEGYFLQATKTSSKLGTKVSAGLPNITGKAGGVYNATGFAPKYDGSFKNSSSSGSVNGGGAGFTINFKQLVFEASESNSIYGNSTTVQPNSYLIYIWRRTA